MGSRILGTGSHTPDRTLTNADLEKLVDTSDEWIVQRTGIRTRHILPDDALPSTMGVDAGARAIAASGLQPEDVEPFFDLKAGCTGFVYGLAVADALVRSGLYKHVLLIGIEALSRVTDWTDRQTCVVFGDGAGAALIGPGEENEGVLGASLYGDADKALLLHIPAGGTRVAASAETVAARQHFVKMEGSGVFRSAAPMMEKATLSALSTAGIDLHDVDWIIPHQANVRIIDALIRRLNVPPERVITNLDRVANTSAASIPLAMDEALRDGRIQPGHVLVLTGFGAGVTYGAVVVRI